MFMRITLTTLSMIATVFAVALLMIATPLAGRALATTRPVPMPRVAPLTTSSWYTTPSYDQAGTAHCPRGTELFDTGRPAVGDAGVVCTALYVEV